MENENEMYRECLRNHAASLGSYATDGCGEFTSDDIGGGSGGGGLTCAACGCHRNFHRKVTTRQGQDAAAAEMIDYGGGGSGRVGAYSSPPQSSSERSSKKRHRTKFTEEQKEKMLGFAEKLEWTLQRRPCKDGVGEDEIESFCRGVGISRKVFKVWMHNHKNNSTTNSGNNASSLTNDDQ